MKTGEQECRERPQVAELLVHHNTLNSKTHTSWGGGGREGYKRFGKWGKGGKLD